MNDNEIIRILIAAIISGEAVAGIPNTPIKQAFQPLRVGANNAPTAYINKIKDMQVAYPKRETSLNADQSLLTTHYNQLYRSTFQISVLSSNNSNLMTASDICKKILYILFSNPVLDYLKSNNLNVLNVDTIRNTPILNDFAQHDKMPSFDIDVLHYETITTTTNATTTIEHNVMRF